MNHYADMISRDQFNAAVDSRNKLVFDIVDLVNSARVEAGTKRNMAVVQGDWATIGAAEIVSRVLTTLQNKINDKVQAFGSASE